MVKELYSIQSTTGSTGSISLKNNEFTYSLAGRNVRTGLNYVTNVEFLESLPLSKVSARVTFLSMMGDKQSVEFVINENDFRALKQNIGK